MTQVPEHPILLQFSAQLGNLGWAVFRHRDPVGRSLELKCETARTDRPSNPSGPKGYQPTPNYCRADVVWKLLYGSVGVAIVQRDRWKWIKAA
jgi:hypothetical protein